MPRPHAPGEPLIVRSNLLRHGLLEALLVDAVALADGRVQIVFGGGAEDPDFPAPDHLTDLWVGADLSCYCAVVDAPCAHQLLVALTLGHPLALPVDDADAASHLERIRHRLRDRLGAARARPVPPRSPRLDALSESLTTPGLTPDEVRARLERLGHHRHPFALNHHHGRTDPALRRWTWGRWWQHLVLDTAPRPQLNALHTLSRLLELGTPAEFEEILAVPALSTPLLRHLDLVLRATPDLAVTLRTHLPAPTLARLLADLPSRASRLALARALGAPATQPVASPSDPDVPPGATPTPPLRPLR